MYLEDRFMKHGTSTAPKTGKNFDFSLNATINLMRAFAIVVADEKIDKTKAASHFSTIKPVKYSLQVTNTIFEQLVFALHQCAAMDEFSKSTNPANIARVASVAWYYGIYAAALSMNVAKNGMIQERHASTADVWCEFAEKNLLLPPFDKYLSTIKKKAAQIELDSMGNSAGRSIATQMPVNRTAADAICIAYLSGTAEWQREKIKDDIRDKCKDSNGQKIKNFLGKEAQTISDKRFAKKKINFLHQAIRFRGKANYRDSLYLGYSSISNIMPGNSVYGDKPKGRMLPYIKDLNIVLKAFTCLAGAYCARRLKKDEWNLFFDNIETFRTFTTSPDDVWLKR